MTTSGVTVRRLDTEGRLVMRKEEARGCGVVLTKEVVLRVSEGRGKHLA